jgi:hypothetical protein
MIQLATRVNTVDAATIPIRHSTATETLVDAGRTAGSFSHVTNKLSPVTLSDHSTQSSVAVWCTKSCAFKHHARLWLC